MQDSPLWTYLQRVQKALKSGNAEAQDIEISNLQEFLDTGCPDYFPSRVYPLILQVLRYYCADILPRLALEAEDRQFVQEVFAATIARLEAQARKVFEIEQQMQRFMTGLKTGEFSGAAKIVAALQRISGGTPELQAGGTPAIRELEHEYRRLCKSSFTAGSLTPFLERLLKTGLSEAEAAQFAPLRSIFWDQAAEQTQMKAALVNPLRQEARITRLDVTTTLDPDGVDHLRFDNEIDERMFSSCWQALEAARRFVERRFPDVLERKGIHVICRFPDPTVEYCDASVSALLGLKVVGDLLAFPVDPGAIISAEVDRSGKILPVNNTVAKVLAADRHPGIRVLYLPFESAPARVERIALRRVSTFSEAVEQYYGAAYQQKQQQISRRKILKGAVGLAIAPLGFFAFKNIFSHPVSEHDLRLLDTARNLYQQNSEYQHAVVILEAVLDRFQQDDSSAEVLQFKADAFGHLGRILLQQHRIQPGFSAYQRAFDCWHDLHDAERQADILVYLGVAHADAAVLMGDSAHYQQALNCYTQAHALLHANMPTFVRLQGNVALWTGMFYHLQAEHARAKSLVQQSCSYFLEAEALWNSQLARQSLAEILVRLGEYDDAVDIFQQTLTLPLLQNPFNQIKSFCGLCDAFLSIGDKDEGLNWACKAKSLCDKYDLLLQQIFLRKILTRHRIPFTNFLQLPIHSEEIPPPLQYGAVQFSVESACEVAST